MTARAAGLAAIVMLAGGCTAQGGSSPPSVPSSRPGRPSATSDLEAARRTWTAAHVTDYDLVVTRSCFCSVAGEFRVSVRRGVPVDVTSTSPGATGSGRSLPEGTPTRVEDLFAIIEREQPTADRLDVDYDPRGVPTKIDIDRIRNAIDDEESIAATLTVVR